VKGLIVLHQTTVQYRTDSSEHHRPGPHSDPRRPTSFPTSPPKTVPHQQTGLFIFKSSYVVVQLVSCIRACMTPLPPFHLSRTMLSFDGLVTMARWGPIPSFLHRLRQQTTLASSIIGALLKHSAPKPACFAQ